MHVALIVQDPRYNWILPRMHPLRFEKNCEPQTSLALLRNDELRAWCIIHVVDGVLRFSGNFACPEQQRSGWIAQLWRRAALLAQRHGWQAGTWTINVDQPRMFTFAKRRMVGKARRVAEFLEAQKLAH